jgi:hypothetical protein
MFISKTRADPSGAPYSVPHNVSLQLLNQPMSDKHSSLLRHRFQVIVPELFLSPPLFHAGYPNSVNMGGLGVRVAQAMLEGVLGRGLLFDSSGRLVILTEGGSSKDAPASTPSPYPAPTPFGTAAVAATSSQHGASYNDPRSVLEVDAQCIVDKYSLQVPILQKFSSSSLTLRLNKIEG